MPTKTKPAVKAQISAREAFEKAREFIVGFYAQQDLVGLRLEAIELSDGDEDWLVTFSFVPRVYEEETSGSATASLLGMPSFNPRLYKEVHVRASDGFAHSMVGASS